MSRRTASWPSSEGRAPWAAPPSSPRRLGPPACCPGRGRRRGRRPPRVSTAGRVGSLRRRGRPRSEAPRPRAAGRRGRRQLRALRLNLARDGGGPRGGLPLRRPRRPLPHHAAPARARPRVPARGPAGRARHGQRARHHQRDGARWPPTCWTACAPSASTTAAPTSPATTRRSPSASPPTPSSTS